MSKSKDKKITEKRKKALISILKRALFYANRKMDNPNSKEKTIKVNFENPEARMKLTVKGKNAVNQALEIMKTFDQTCNEIREQTNKGVDIENV